MRKTNLFYKNGQDSNFLTFSNYGEDLTKNYFNMNKNIVPCAFVCLYVLNIDIEENREKFIKYLVLYYENKLATLRDLNKLVYPMSYLFDALYHMDSNFTYSKAMKTPNVDLQYIGLVADFNISNSLFADFIMTIDDNDKYTFVGFNSNDLLELSVQDTLETLHNWVGEVYSEINDTYGTPLYDTQSKKEYVYTQQYNGIKYKREIGDINFNVIIPIYTLFDYCEFGDNEWSWNVDDKEAFVPYGIWIGNTDNLVSLIYDNKNKIRASWSMMISTLFKPFPYTDPVKVYETNKSEDYVVASYKGFADILKNYTILTNKYNDLNNMVIKVARDVLNLTNILKDNKMITDNQLTEYPKITEMKEEIKDLREELASVKETLSTITIVNK